MSVSQVAKPQPLPSYGEEDGDFVLPCLGHILNDWDQGIHQDYDTFKVHLNNDLKKIAPNEKVLKVLLSHDYAQVYARMWSKCDFDTLQTLSHLTMWLVYLDDKVDCKSGDLHDDLAELVSYMDKIRVFVAECLGLGEAEPSLRCELDGFVRSFEPIGRKLQSLPLDKILFFQASLGGYLESLIEEQQMAHLGGPQNMQEYMYVRRRTIIMLPVCAVASILLSDEAREALDIRIPEMLPIWEALADAMIFTNDIVSLRMEIDKPESANCVKVLAQDMTLEKAMDVTVGLLIDSVNRFEETSATFVASAQPENVEYWTEYFAALKSMVAGYYRWSLTTTRYGN